MNVLKQIELKLSKPINTPLSKVWFRDGNIKRFKHDVTRDFKLYHNSELYITRSTYHLVQVSSQDGKQVKVYNKHDYRR